MQSYAAAAPARAAALALRIRAQIGADISATALVWWLQSAAPADLGTDETGLWHCRIWDIAGRGETPQAAALAWARAAEAAQDAAA